MMRDATTPLPHLPDLCIANALSFTSPRDASRLSLVSRTFRSAAEFDALWDSFLPRDYPSIISRSCTPPPFSSKKHLYLSLCDKPLLIDDGLKSFLLDKPSGKKCYMLYARSLSIVWACTPRYWRWTSVPQARFNEVAELLSVCWLEIRGRINTRMLSPSTLYATYLVFNLTVDANGFEDQPVEASIRIPGSGTLNRTVYLDAERGRRLQYQIFTRIMGVEARTPIPTENLDLQYPKQRADGWLEIELGNFFNEGGDDQELEMAVREIKGGHWKSGLVIQGFDIRPKLNQ